MHSPAETLPQTEAVQAQLEKAVSWAKRKAKQFCSFATLKEFFPILEWLPKYLPVYLVSDVLAGLTVGMTVIPQSMAYASVAGLPLQYGLYSAFMGCFVYCFFGGSYAINVGPTAIMALLTVDHVSHMGLDAAVLLCFLAGCIQLLCGICRLGFLIDFISAPVISGFTSAAAIVISSTQLKGLLGIKLSDENLYTVLYSFGVHIKEINYWDLGLGMSCLVLLLVLRRLGSMKWNEDDALMWKVVLRKTLWFISAGRNALVVILAACLTFVLVAKETNVFSLTGNIPSGIPPFKSPPFSLTTVENKTLSFKESVQEYGTGLFLVPLMGTLEHIAIAKAFARGKSLDASQELIALGCCNIAGSFVSSFPQSGSFSRTALNNSCGVKSPLGGIITGIVVLLALGLLAPSFHYIPKASLSAVIITAVIFMIEFHVVPKLWKTKKTDLFVMTVTFVSCLFMGIEYGILLGIFLSVLVLLYSTARPRIKIEKMKIHDKEYTVVRPDRMLNFPSVEYLRYRIFKATKGNEYDPVILDGMYLCKLDFTVAECMKDLINSFEERNQILIWINLTPNVVKKIEVLGPKSFLHFQTKEDLEDVFAGGLLLKEIKVIEEIKSDSNKFKSSCSSRIHPSLTESSQNLVMNEVHCHEDHIGQSGDKSVVTANGNVTIRLRNNESEESHL